MAHAYTKVQGYQLAATVTNRAVGEVHEISAPGPAEETLTVAYRAPDWWRLRSSTNGQVNLFRDNRVYFLQSMGAGGFAGMAQVPPGVNPKDHRTDFARLGFVDYTAITEGLFAAAYLRQEDVVAEGVRIPCAVIEADYSPRGGPHDQLRGLPPPRGQRGGNPAGDTDFPSFSTAAPLGAGHWKRGQNIDYRVLMRTLWVDTARDVVLREVDVIHSEALVPDPKIKSNVAATFEHTFTVLNLEWNHQPPEGLFEVPVPAGTVRSDDTVVPAANGRVPLVPVTEACKKIDDPWSREVCIEAAQHRPCQHLPLTPEVQAARLAGRMTISFTVDADGVPVNIRVKQGVGLGLDELAAACVAAWRYRPPMKDEAPPNTSTTFGPVGAYNNNSFWHLSHVEFQTENGAKRPIFLKTKYPEPKPLERVLGFSLFHVRLIIGKDGIPQDIQVVPPADPKLDKAAIQIVSSWRFRPGEEDGQPVDVPARFDLGLGSGTRLLPTR